MVARFKYFSIVCMIADSSFCPPRHVVTVVALVHNAHPYNSPLSTLQNKHLEKKNLYEALFIVFWKMVYR